VSTPATVEEAVQQTLKANSALMLLLTGGIWITREPMENQDVVRANSGKGDILPLAVITPLPVVITDQWEADVMGVITRPFAIYLYQAGPAYDIVEAAQQLIEHSLPNGRLPNTTNYTCQTPQLIPDQPASIEKYLNFASLIISRWQVVTRRI
jgi:hypothetical protein